MAKKSLRLSVGSIFTKGPGKIYFYHYQLDGHRKTVSLQTTNRAEAVKKAEALLPIIKATSTEVIAAHVQQARGLSSPIRELSLDGVWDYYSTHPERATPATVNEQIQYRTTLDEFIRFIGNPQMEVRKISNQHTEKFAQYLIGFDVATDNCRRLPVAAFLHLDENPAGQFDFEGGAEFPIQRTHRDDGATAAPTGIQIGADAVM